MVLFGDVDEDEDQDREAADGEVDPEACLGSGLLLAVFGDCGGGALLAPTPACVLREGTPDEWSAYQPQLGNYTRVASQQTSLTLRRFQGQTSSSLTAHQDARSSRPFPPRHKRRDDSQGPVEQSAGPEARHDSTSDQHARGVGKCADQRAQLEDEEEADVGPLVWQIREQLARGRLQR